jgi:hypothetical protein
MDNDPVTGKPYPPDAIQRILYVTPKVHIYRIPPITSTKGFNAATWTQNPKDLIFTCRLRILETAIPPPASSPPDTPEKVSTTILLEDPTSGQLFAASPYTSPAVVEQAMDSSRFFAIRVVGDGGMKATLGLGFEERPEAFDFGVCLQDVRRVLEMEAQSSASGQKSGKRVGASGKAPIPAPSSEIKRDYSLKEGETIKINLGARTRRNQNDDDDDDDDDDGEDGAVGGQRKGSASLFSIPPPPSSSSSGNVMPFLPPPPGAAEVKAGRRRQEHSTTNAIPSQPVAQEKQPSAADLGFDDGEFGEFQ